MRSLFLLTCDGLNSHVCSLSVLLFLWRYYLLSCGFPYGLRVIFYLYRQWQLISCCWKLVSLGRIGLVKSWLFHIDSNTFLYQSLYSLVWTLISMSFHRSSYMDFIGFFSFLLWLYPPQLSDHRLRADIEQTIFLFVFSMNQRYYFCVCLFWKLREVSSHFMGTWFWEFLISVTFCPNFTYRLNLSKYLHISY